MVEAKPPSLVPLTSLALGARGLLQMADLDSGDSALLAALGLREGSRFRVCKQGEPWIVQVRSTRIGLAQRIARQLFVEPLAAD